MEDTLEQLRSRIDHIDKQIVDLLKERSKFVRKVGKLKEKSDNGLSFIRPGREAIMLRQLINTMAHYPPHAVAAIWRMIISSSLHMEKPMDVYAYISKQDEYCYWLGREYYGNFINIYKMDCTNEIITKVAENRIAVGILPLIDDRSSPWWLRPVEEKNAIYAFARLPFVLRKDAPEKSALAIANVIPEETGDDISLLAIKTSLTKQQSRLFFSQSSWKGAIIASHRRYLLVEVPQFISPHSPVLASLQEALGADSQLRVLGMYAAPLKARLSRNLT